jgi:hypothetical protein
MIQKRTLKKSRGESNTLLFTHISSKQVVCSVVGVATCYRLDGLGIKSWWGQDFLCPSKPALKLTQPPVQWVLGLSWE